MFRPPPLPELDCILSGHRSLLALRRGLWASVGWTPSCSTWDRGRRFLPATAACFGRRQLAEFRAALRSVSGKLSPLSTWILACGLSSVPDAHSSKMSWWKIASASAPPWEPPLSCRIAVRVEISPLLSARSRLETYFRRNSSIWMGRTFAGSTSLWSWVRRSSGISAATSCASVRDRNYSSSSNIFVVGSFAFFRNTNCVLDRSQHSSGTSPAPHLTVRMSRILKTLLFCLASAKAMMASRCSCRAPGALMVANLTWESDAIPVLLRPCSLTALRADLHLPPPQASRLSRLSSLRVRGMCTLARAPGNNGLWTSASNVLLHP